jgi:hypothetical protein
LRIGHLLDEALLKELLHSKELGRKDKLLLVLATGDAAPKAVSKVRQLAVSNGLRAAKEWNISALLAGGEVLSIRTDAGWELTARGKERVRALAGPAAKPVAAQTAAELRSHLTSITNADVLAFLSEAISCLEVKALRAAVVLSWVGAVALIYDAVIDKHLAAFNAEARRRDAKWKDAKTADDLARMKEHDLLDVLEAISVIGKNVKQELQGALKLRNACGHPNSLKIGSSRVSSHIEILILNVFTQF